MNARGRFAVATAVGGVLIGGLAWATEAAYHPLRPRVLCQLPLGNGETAVYFGFTSDAEHAVWLPPGEDNRVSAWARVAALPDTFAAGGSGRFPDAAFVATFRAQDVPPGESLRWRLGTRDAQLTLETPRCPILSPRDVPDDVVWVKPRPLPLEPAPAPPRAPAPAEPVATASIKPTPPTAPRPERPTRRAKPPQVTPPASSEDDAPSVALPAAPTPGVASGAPPTDAGSSEPGSGSSGAGGDGPATSEPAPAGPPKLPAMSPEAWASAVGAQVQRGLRYPSDAEEDGVEGVSVVRLDVGADGAILAASLRTSAGDARLDRAALARCRALGRVTPPPDGARQLDLPIRFQVP